MKTLMITLTCAMLVTAGCSKPETANSGNSGTEPSGSQYLIDVEPANATPVGEARQSTKDGDSVTLVGHIGGSSEPFVDGLAAFTIVDPEVQYCQPDEGCPTPWDYCCTQNEVKENIATVKIVNDSGSPVEESAKQLLDVKELSLVVVEGKAKRDDQGNLSVLADKVFVKKR